MVDDRLGAMLEGAGTGTEPLEIETDDTIVLVLGAPGGKRTVGLTRGTGVTPLEKLIFLLVRETPAREWMTDKADFRSWRFGPFSSKVYEAADTSRPQVSSATPGQSQP